MPRTSQRSFGKAQAGRHRHTDHRPQFKKVLVVTEGAVTEQEYLEYIRGTLGHALTLSCKPGKRDPYSVVSKALKLREAETKEKGDPFDEVWVLIDVDSHAHLTDALTLAEKKGIRVGLCNPCFEVWLLMHLHPVSASSTNTKVSKEWEGLSKSGRKAINIKALSGKFETAEENARKSRASHVRNGLRETENPSTNVDLLVRMLLDSARESSNSYSLSL